MTDEDLMPIMGGKVVRGVPMERFSEQQAQTNHGQTLRRLRERGGLSPGEALAVIERREWRRMDQAEAEDKLSRYVFLKPKEAPNAG